MKATELQKIIGLNLPTELPCIGDLITRLERHLAEERDIQSRLPGDDPHHARTVADYKQRITLLEKILEELRQPNFQFDQEQKSVLSDLSDLSVPQVPPATPNPAKNDFRPPTESNLQYQQHPAESDSSPAESEPSSAEFQPSSAESNSIPTDSQESQIPPSTSEPDADADSTGASSVTKSPSFYDLIDAERKLDANDLKELSICFAEHKSARSPLDKLDPQTQTAILLLMAQRPTWMVVKLLAQPAPIGIGFETTDSSLNNFRTRHKERAEKAARQQRNKEIENILSDNKGDIFKTTVHLMERRLLKALSGDNTTPDDLQRISRSLATLRRQALAEGHPIEPYAHVAQASQPAVSPASSRQPLEKPSQP